MSYRTNNNINEKFQCKQSHFLRNCIINWKYFFFSQKNLNRDFELFDGFSCGWSNFDSSWRDGRYVDENVWVFSWWINSLWFLAEYPIEWFSRVLTGFQEHKPDIWTFLSFIGFRNCAKIVIDKYLGPFLRQIQEISQVSKLCKLRWDITRGFV